MSNRPLDDKKASQERQLFEFTQRLAKFRAGRRAIHIHLSQLRADNRRGHHIRIAVNTFEFLVKQMDGQIFALSNADLIFVCKGADIAAIDEAVKGAFAINMDGTVKRDRVVAKAWAWNCEYAPTMQKVDKAAPNRLLKFIAWSGLS